MRPDRSLDLSIAMSYRYLPLILLFFLILAPETYAQTFFTGTFSAAQQPDEVTSEATGTAALALTDEGLRFIISVEGLSGDIANAHFHQAPTGVNGGVVFPIFDFFDGGTAIGTWAFDDPDNPLTDDLLADLLLGNLYLNIHTDANPGGEIRAQVLPTSGTGLTARLTADQEPGDVTSDATGTAYVQVTDAGALFSVTVNGLSGDIANAHFHQAPTGVNGGVAFGIFDFFDGNTAFGFWPRDDAEAPLTDDLLTELLTGNLYLNIHTAANTGGEIRGQVLLTSGWGFSATLDADQETGDVTSDATGTAALTFTEAGLAFHITAEGLSGPIMGAHFHNAPAGTDGGVVFDIGDFFDGTTASGLWPAGTEEGQLTSEMVRELLAGNLYLNLHTDANPGGEIRGQVLPNAGTSLAATLTPDQVPGGVEQDASGTAALTLTDAGLIFDITLEGLSGDIANAHFHQAPTGVNGGVAFGIFDFFDGNTAQGTWAFDDAEAPLGDFLTDLLAGNLYLNIHTDANPGGEIRGQVHLSGGTGLRATLTNEQVTDDVEQDASGTAALTLTEAGLVFDLTVDNLSGDIANAHFHQAPTGVNGGVAFGIFDFFDGNTAQGLWPTTGDNALTEEMRDALLAGGLYLNIHTDANPGGEIRGQVEVAGGIGSAIHLSPEQETHDVTSDAQGTASVTLTDAGLVFNTTVEGLTGDITAAHFHNNVLGLDGPPVRTITDDFDGNTAFGVWRSTDEESLTPDLMAELLDGATYLNVHTEANGAGEARGQVLPNGIVVTSIETVDEVPEAFNLAPNYPNPFNPATTIEFSLMHATHAVLTVYNTLGQKVATLVNKPLPAGTFRLTFDASALPSGVYHYRLEADGTARTRSMLLVK